jgi:methionyl-tRNA synthetase
MREMVLGQDSNFTMESFTKRYNSDLANDFGNLLSRVSRLIQKNFDGKMPKWGEPTSAENEMKKQAEGTIEKVNKLIHNMRINESIEETMQFIRSINRYMEQQVPWKRVKEDKSAAGRVLITAAEAMRLGALLLQPVMPNRTLIVLETLNAEHTSLAWGQLKPGSELKEHPSLFPRIEVNT